jgi:hypothetical protein
VDTLCGILSTIKHGTTASRDADPVNRALNAIGGSAISNGSHFWSASRCSAINAWYSSGIGFLSYNFMCVSFLALPVALLDVSEANI